MTYKVFGLMTGQSSQPLNWGNWGLAEMSSVLADLCLVQVKDSCSVCIQLLLIIQKIKSNFKSELVMKCICQYAG